MRDFFVFNAQTLCFLRRKSFFRFDENVEIRTYSNQNIFQDSSQQSISSTRQTTNNSSIQFRTPIYLFILNPSPVDWSISFIDKISPILLAIQFTSLFVSFSDLSIRTLVKIIGLVPNLDSLKVFTLSLQELSSLSMEDTESLRLVSISNKITRVLQSMLAVDMTDFLINLCPRMEHFETKWMGDTDLERCVRVILMKTITCIPNLHSLRFDTNKANDEKVHKLQKMIDSEKLLSNYTIKRSGDYISLRWT
jgi:hypothetical protein